MTDFKKGDRIVLTPEGDEGTIVDIDGVGEARINWDHGSDQDPMAFYPLRWLEKVGA